MINSYSIQATYKRQRLLFKLVIFVKIIYFQDLQGVKLILRTELCIKNPHQKSGFECKGYDLKIKCDRVINTAQIFLVLTRFLIT